jgi:nitrite reductase (NO-forming)
VEQVLREALLHARPGSERPAHLRFGVLNIGVVAVLSGITSAWHRLAGAGAALVVSAVLAHVASLLAMTRPPRCGRHRPAGRPARRGRR